MFINKIGMEHLETGMNCQDYGFVGERSSYVCDGCSEGKHSEVGVKLFCHLMQRSQCCDNLKNFVDVNGAFCRMINLIGEEPRYKRDFLSFTILRLDECTDFFAIAYCGDGYIILQDHDSNITFEELSDGEYPKYYIYNYIEPEYLKHYKDGVSFSQKTYSKEKYAKVGIASDGLRYILQADEELKQEFINCLKSGKELKTKLFINRNHKIFKDDVTIVF
jgi:hypothetical protein